MRILVTGGCGYKGSVLVPKLLAKGHVVNVVDVLWFGNFLSSHPQLQLIEADIRYPQAEWFNGIEAIIHLAAVANDPCSELNPQLTWEVGALATMQLVDRAVKHGVKQFIYTSSGSVYGVSELPQVTEDIALNPISAYNKAKMVTERVLLSYANDLIIQIVRPATVCGYSPRMRLDVSVNMMSMQALTKGAMTVFGGTQVRPNIHIDDVTDLYLFLLDHPEYQGIYNAGFENLSILDIAQLVAQYVPAEIKITPSNDPRSYRLNSDRLLQTGFRPKKNVKQAIQELIMKYQTGELGEDDRWHNIRSMKKMSLVS